MLRLRARPQDLPATDTVLMGTVLAAVGAGLLAIRRLYPTDMALARIGVDLALQLGFVVAALRVTGRPERFRQTFSALCGTGALLVLLTWPLIDILMDQGPEDQLFGVALITLFAVYGWSVVVVGHILRHALELGFGKSVLLALAYLLASTALADSVVPVPELESP